MPYQRVSGGWRVSDQERPRWDYDGWLRSSGSEHWKATPNPGRELPTLQAATEALEDAGVYLDQGLRIMFTDAYDIDPKQTTQAAFHVARTANSLDNPSGLLAKRLREIT
jgi:hypothetical protein